MVVHPIPLAGSRFCAASQERMVSKVVEKYSPSSVASRLIWLITARPDADHIDSSPEGASSCINAIGARITRSPGIPPIRSAPSNSTSRSTPNGAMDERGIDHPSRAKECASASS
ncbi:hypothetical protein ACFFX0_29405 [Citricoccus parietis]|uniref:Uncharacterized protein n=1 Tax=Citricoccus parietis TaxID=592307 RepID=A0ABV5G7Z0_9MICC